MGFPVKSFDITHLHDELVVLAQAEVEDVEVDGGAHVVDVGEEDVLPPLLHELVQHAGVVEGLVEVAVPGRVPPAVKTMG